ncbi:MAG: S-layer homology domain-containing protein [Oscillospiraceae bacterium]|nr:S-layer homology domain-containing protein [Oscillospiraceae bacterium]
MKRTLSVFLPLTLLAALLFTVSAPASALAAREVEFGQTVALSRAAGYAITRDGTLWYWGSNSENMWTGDQSPERSVPGKLTDGVVSVTAGDWGAVITKADGSLWLFGSGYAGDGTDWAAYFKPVRIPLEGVVSVSVGNNHILALKADGTVWGWGSNATDGQVGGGRTWDVLEPVQIFEDAICVSAGQSHSLAVKKDGSLWAWGYNAYNQLGVVTDEPYSLYAVKVMDGVKSAVADGLASYAVTTDGELLAWGYGYDTVPERPAQVGGRMTKTSLMDGVSSVPGGNYAIRADNTMWTWAEDIRSALWGDSGSGVTVAGTSNRQFKPWKLADDVASAAARHSSALILRPNGTLLGYGSDASGQLGLGSRGKYYFEPRAVIDSVAVPGSALGVPSDWARADIESAIAAGLVPESLQGRYGENITRAEFAGLAVRLVETVLGRGMDAYLAEKNITPGIPFTDTTSKDVAALAALGVVDGVGGGRFAPGREITREQAAKLLAGLARLLGLGEPGYIPVFADSARCSGWASGFVGYVSGHGIMGGTGGGGFSPLDGYTREAAIITSLRITRLLAG